MRLRADDKLHTKQIPAGRLWRVVLQSLGQLSGGVSGAESVVVALPDASVCWPLSSCRSAGIRERWLSQKNDGKKRGCDM